MQEYFTADGTEITDGLIVWNYYDMVVGKVDFRQSYADSPHFDGWFQIVDNTGRRVSLVNGERMSMRHPFTKQSAADGWKEKYGEDWPQVRDGVTVWACCVSEIGPTCQHRA